MQGKMIEAFVAMLEDSDSMVRRTGVEILGTVGNQDAENALRNIADDPSPRVREAVVKSLEQIRVLLT